MRIHRDHADRQYTDPQTGEPTPETGALQIAFCDRGTPKDNGEFTIYQAIKNELEQRGMDPARVRFIHEARNSSELKTLFSQCNRGEVSVLIGSTEKMGTGTNVQRRAAALHHVDVPWRPADLEQREGRIIRQGNENETIEILNYVTESTYDTVMWQKVQAKALFIEQVRSNEVLTNEIEEDLSGGDIGAAAAETKAIATGDPRYVRQVELDDQVRRLTALDRNYRDSVRRRDLRVEALQRYMPQSESRIDELAPVAEKAEKYRTSDQPATLIISGSTYRDRPAAAEALSVQLRRAYTEGKDRGASRFEPIGATINGVDVHAARDLTHNMLLLRLTVASRTVEIDHTELAATGQAHGAPKQLGLLKRLENLYADLPAHRQRLVNQLTTDRDELQDLLDNPPGPFPEGAELDAKKAELDALTLELKMAAQSPEAQAAAEAAKQRMDDRGRKPGWSLLLNPTPAVVEHAGLPDADAMRRVVRERERMVMAEQLRQRDIDGPDPDPDPDLDQ